VLFIKNNNESSNQTFFALELLLTHKQFKSKVEKREKLQLLVRMKPLKVVAHLGSPADGLE